MGGTGPAWHASLSERLASVTKECKRYFAREAAEKHRSAMFGVTVGEVSGQPRFLTALGMTPKGMAEEGGEGLSYL